MKQAKVVIVGKDEAGKSTLVQNIIPSAMNIERQGRTIALDYGNRAHKGYKLHLVPYEKACFEREQDKEWNAELYALTKLLAK